MSIDRLLAQYGQPVQSWPGEEALDDEARANMAAGSARLSTEGGATDAGSLLPITRYPKRVGSDPASWRSASDVLASLDDGWRIEPFNRMAAPFKSMLEGLRSQPLLGPMVRPSQMRPDVLDQMSGDAMSVAGAGIAGNIPRVLAGAPAGTTELGIFGGRSAKTADRAALARAEEMAAAGAPREQIWADTGWFQGVDGQWRFEIDDSGMKPVIGLRDWINRKDGVTMAPHIGAAVAKAAESLTPEAPVRIKRVYEHPELDQAYPHGFTSSPEHSGIMGVPLQLIEGGNASGMYIPEGWKGRPSIGIHETLPPGPARDTLIHELQHAVQEKEGFQAGGNQSMGREYLRAAWDREADAISESIRAMEQSHPAEFAAFRRKNAAEATKEWDVAIAAETDLMSTEAGRALAELDWRRSELYKREPSKEEAHEAYRALAGEVEAVTASKRARLTPEERAARPPWMDYDVPESQQIVRFGDRGPQASSPDPAFDKMLDEVAPPVRGAPSPVPVSLDPLGYFSPALEAAKGLKQAKGTAEQMLAQIKKAGVRDGEIEASGLAAFLDGKKSVTRDEIVKHLDENRVGVQETFYGGGEGRSWDNYTDPGRSNRAQVEAPKLDGAAGGAKWSSYSLDPSNPTYRETVLHLPERPRSKFSSLEEYTKAYKARYPGASDIDAHRAYTGELVRNRADHDNTATFSDDFRSGHFPEPNIVGHMMTSMVSLPAKAKFTRSEIADIGERMAKAVGARRVEDMGSGAVTTAVVRGAVTNAEAMAYASNRGWATARDSSVPDKGSPVFLIDQIQSDWGQKLRDGGIRDEAKIAGLKAKRDALLPENFDYDWLRDAGGDLGRAYHNALEQLGRDHPTTKALKAVDPSAYRLANAELLTAEASTPGHPLVNTTDQWTNTTLRRAIRQAAEADAEYIAIPSGKTVLSYNPGDAHGMGEFYDKIVPKNLKNILTKMDKNAPPPIRVDTLDSPSGKTDLGRGFTLFPLTPVIKKQALEGGMPLFKSGGAVRSSLSSRVPDLTPARRALQSAVPRPEARTSEDILNRYAKKD